MFGFAFGNLRSRPLRSALSILGLTVAIAGMVGLFSIAGGVDELVASTFKLIPGVLVQQRGAPVPLFSTLPSEWEQEIEEIPGVAVVNSEVLTRVNVIEDKPIISPPRFFLGVDIASRLRLKQGVYAACMEEGRFLEAGDVGTRNAVVSRQIAEEFDKQVGDTLRVNGNDVEIVGLYYSGSMLLDVSIVMDIGTVREISRYDPGSVSSYYVETTGDEPDAVVCRRIEDHFAGRELGRNPYSSLAGLLGEQSSNPLADLFRDLDAALKDEPDSESPARDGEPEEVVPDDTDAVSVAAEEEQDAVESPVEVRAADDWADRFDDFMADLDLFLMLMTTIGVVIAVLSIVNTMLMSVTERRIEFGILRANGWSRRDVLSLVTFESALLGVLGGVLGCLFGWCATHVVNWWFPERVHLYAGAGLLAFSLVFSVLLGVLGGVYPAWTASRLSPMEAIRRG
jgi:putative ABC transport system permease protein